MLDVAAGAWELWCMGAVLLGQIPFRSPLIAGEHWGQASTKGSWRKWDEGREKVQGLLLQYRTWTKGQGDASAIMERLASSAKIHLAPRVLGSFAVPYQQSLDLNQLKTRLSSPMIPEMRSVAVRAKKSSHDKISQTVRCGDARELHWIPDESVHLVLTSPPYWTLKEYPANENQLGLVADYEKFHDELDKVWRHCFRVLVPGGRLVCVVGDVCLSRRRHGRHMVMPLHADVVVRCRKIGFDNLNPIFWHKISNAAYEVENGSSFLGKPYEPNAIIKNDMEFILMLRKSGGYRQPTEDQRDASRLTKEEHHEWFQQVWTIPGESTRSHPAPYPEELAYRLVRMFSFTGDTVLDPFMGLGTTLVAAAKCGRNAIGVEIDPAYFAKATARIQGVPRSLFAVP